jgi:hypothetical protein
MESKFSFDLNPGFYSESLLPSDISINLIEKQVIKFTNLSTINDVVSGEYMDPYILLFFVTD